MNNRNVNIAVIASYGKSVAIWNCIKQHIDMMSESGARVTLFVSNAENTDLIQSEYNDLIVRYNDKKNLRKKIKSIGTDVIWYPDVICTVKYGRLSSKCRIITWIQGTLPDESYLRNKSKIRKWILEVFERIALRRSDGVVFVSSSMRNYYESKYRTHFLNYAEIPCISDFSEYTPISKRITESYVYIGGTAMWQCFDDIVSLYSKIRTKRSIFHIITLNTEEARKIVESKISNADDISIYSITDRMKIPEILSTFQYGFLIRKESPVNYVSSPIKFLEYLSCGVNVIMTDAVPSYAKLVKENKVGTIIDLNHWDEMKIEPFSNNAREVYEKYFNKQQFVHRYKHLLEI